MATISEGTTNKWGKATGKGPMGLDWSGCYPATIIPFKDKTCREVDEEAFRILVRDILEADIAGLDPNEVEEFSGVSRFLERRMGKRISFGKSQDREID